MAYKALLEIDGTTYKVDNCNFSLHQATDHRHNKPTSEVSPSSISFDVRVDGDRISDLWKWGMDPREKRSGNVKFYKVDEDASMFELNFEDGYCTTFSYHMSSSGSSDMTVHVEISCRKLGIGEDQMEMEWGGDF